MRDLMLGNQAVARGAFEAGVRVATAYPGTPSTEITEHLAEYAEIDSEWSVNEKVALEIGIGAAIAGARALVSMKHVGLNVAMDPLLSIAYPGVNAGLVVVVADDPGQHSSQNEQDTRTFAPPGKLPVLEPSDSQECKDFILSAFELSERFDTLVLVRLTTRVAHSMSLVEVGPRRDIPLREHDTRHGKYINAPAFSKKRRVVAEDRLHKLEAYAETTPLNRIEMRDPSLGIVTSGIAYQYVREVAPTASVFKIGLSYPLPRERLLEFSRQCAKLLVVEELEPIFEHTIHSFGIAASGKDRVPVIGELSPEIVRAALGDAPLAAPVAPPAVADLPVRPPMLCAGCHHRGPFTVLRKLKLHVSGDIGCYTLAAFPPLSAMETAVCMGGSIGMAFGYEKARGREFAKKTVAVIGDSTFWHSGITALVDVVYNRGITTLLILDNRTTAMTGHQDNPSTGSTLGGATVPAIDFAALARSLGIQSVREVDAYDLDELEKVIREEVSREAPSVIITKRPCLLASGVKKPGLALEVDEDLCKACRLCVRLGCPALSVVNSLASIDPSLCAGCGLCASTCPFDAIARVQPE
ncbi:MAG: indolepyruvate ferredoxin oxidoreductase subunit alpha [Polyangiaceae bacterium]|jgi:indolepyruvate ferredoxin oxidoreductase alpha subunit